MCMSATGQHMPPYVIFPRVRMHDSLKKGAPNGTRFNCNPSGYMNSEVFLDWFDHFVDHVNPTEKNPALLIIDGHSSHTKNLAFAEKARANFVTVIVLPPHCSNKMQPLDVAFMGPFKSFYASASEDFMRKFPGKIIGLYDISEIMCAAFVKAATMDVAVSGFRKTGIWPFNRNVFTDDDFAPSEVTDQPECTTVTLITITDPMAVDTSTVQQISLPKELVFPESQPVELPFGYLDALQIDPSPVASPNSSFIVSPMAILPLPKMSAPRAVKRKRKVEHAVEITGDNYRQDLATSEASKTIKAIKKGRKPVKKRTKAQKQDECREDVLCDQCGGTFSESKDGQGWKTCVSCLMWFHAECENVDNFKCRFCN